MANGKGLTKAEQAERDEHAENLRELAGKIIDEVREFNDKRRELWTPVQRAVEAYNEAVQMAQEFVEGIAGEADEFADGRSERWQETDKGQAFIEWRDEWGGTQFDVVESLDEPDELDEPMMDAAETLEALSDAPAE